MVPASSATITPYWSAYFIMASGGQRLGAEA